MTQHHATFTWGAGPNSVHISGGFNNWSATASPLHKQQDGTFTAEIPLPWGEKQAFKYVVDGEWKVREDEAKEWDAAGNMNNVYTAPPQPAEVHEPAPVAAAPVAHTESKHDAPEPAPVPAIAKAEPAPIAASSAPAAASTSSSHLNGYALGAPILVGAGSTSSTAHTTKAPVSAAPTADLPPTPVAPVTTAPAGPATIEKTISSAEQIEKTAAKANVGEAHTEPQEEGILDKATAFGATALAGIGAYVGAAAVAVEKATGVDLTHGQPLTIAEAKAAGVDLNRIEKRDAETDTVSPVNSKPPAAAVEDLSQKVEDLKIGSASKPKEEHQANDLPAQHETTDNHKTVPMPVITAISEKDPKKDRSLDGAAAGSAAKPIGTDPSISAKSAKAEAEVNPGKTGSTLSQVHGSSPASASTPVPGPAATGPVPAGGAIVSPNTSSTNPHAPSPPKKDTSGIHSAPKSSLGQAPEPKTVTSPTPAAAPTSATGPAVTPAAAPAFAANPPPVAATPSPVAPSTPAKATPVAQTNGTPSSIQTTPASTPVKSAHQKESTSGSDVRKRKSSFFHKLKTAFSPKDKEKK